MSPVGVHFGSYASANDDDYDEYLAFAFAFSADSSVPDRHIVATVVAASPTA